MTYNVYSIRKGNYRCIVGTTRKGLTREEAYSFATMRNSNVNKKCHYVVVSENCISNFFAKVKEENIKLEAARAKKWAEIDTMRKKGYVMRDTLEYLNK